MDTPTASDRHAVNPAPRSWLAENFGSLFVTVVIAALIVMYLNVVDVAKVLIGLGLVIFIHELGHFAAAKWCDVHVETFSIGFGPPVPGCRWKYGETTYMLALIPLGGYVKMLGEGEGGEEGEEGEDNKNPRSFKNKSVGQRMLIISAGVIMNIFLAAVCFVIAYMHGVEERPAIIGRVETASAAWRAGLHSNDRILQIGDKKNPVFADIQPTVMSTHAGELVRLEIDNPYAPDKTRVVEVEPQLDGEGLYPMLGVGPQLQLTVIRSSRPGLLVTRPGSSASKADPGFRAGDRIVGVSDPDKGGAVTPLPPDPADPSNDRRDFAEYARRMVRLRDKAVTYQVARDGEGMVQITVEPEPTRDFGMRMRMGQVAAVRKDSPAVNAKLVGTNPPEATAGVQARKAGAKPDADTPGDTIVAVEVEEADGTRTRFVSVKSMAKEEGVVERMLDPVRLPFELDSWAARKPKNLTVRMTVSRIVQKHPQDVRLEMEYDPSWAAYQETINSPTTPLPIGGLGLAYAVETLVEEVEKDSPAEKAGIQKGDVITHLRGKYLAENGAWKEGRGIDLAANQWAFVFSEVQTGDSPDVTFKLKRGEADPIEVAVTAEPDPTWPAVNRGIYFHPDFRLHKADGIVDALGMGANRTMRTIRIIYQNLSAMVVGRVSAWTMSGPLTIADVSYKIAGENMWQFILFIGMISVNLAVINFLPIPVLDGGHMVFLIYEKIVGKPAPERLQVAAMFIGLAFILSLMAFVLFLDIRRLWF